MQRYLEPERLFLRVLGRVDLIKGHPESESSV